jgi:hypothetical protein|nr:MAG TPA: replication initiator protein [Caudoviricetes sp.]
MDKFNSIQEYKRFKHPFLFPTEFITKANLFSDLTYSEKIFYCYLHYKLGECGLKDENGMYVTIPREEMADFFEVTGKTIGVWMKKLMEYGLVCRGRNGFLDVSKTYVADLDEIIEGAT